MGIVKYLYDIVSDPERYLLSRTNYFTIGHKEMIILLNRYPHISIKNGWIFKQRLEIPWNRRGYYKRYNFCKIANITCKSAIRHNEIFYYVNIGLIASRDVIIEILKYNLYGTD